MNDTEFTTRLDACLDAHLDPLDDAELCQFLAAHPERLASFAAQVERLGALPCLVSTLDALPLVRRPRPWLPMLMLAAATAAGVVLWCDRGGGDQPAAGPRSRILWATLHEVRPRVHMAAQFEVRQNLLATATATLQVYERRSEPR